MNHPNNVFFRYRLLHFLWTKGSKTATRSTRGWSKRMPINSVDNHMRFYSTIARLFRTISNYAGKEMIAFNHRRTPHGTN